MPKLPRASGDKHASAFKEAGWQVNHKNKILGIGLLKKLIEKAGLTNDQYIRYFNK